MRKSKKSSNNPKEQKELINSLEGIGDILVYETIKLNQTNEVVGGLHELEKIVKQLFHIQEIDPKRFESMILDHEYFELFNENKREAQLRLSFHPEKYLLTFNTAIKQIIRVFDAALNNGNQDISRYSTYSLVYVLAIITQTKNNDLFVEPILRRLYDLSSKALKSDNRAIYSSLIDWYPDIIFNDLKQRGKHFRLHYLELFNLYFFENIKRIINDNRSDLFNYLVSVLIDGIHVETEISTQLWEHVHILLTQDVALYRQQTAKYKFEKQINVLINRFGKIKSIREYNLWIRKFNRLNRRCVELLNVDNLKKSKEIKISITKTVRRYYSYTKLLEMLFSAISFALYKQRYELIKELWEHKQPPDATASFGGTDLYPESLNDTIVFYFFKKREYSFDFWEDHHGTEKYKQQYFLLLVLKYLKDFLPYGNTIGESQEEKKKYPDIENYNVPISQTSTLVNITHQVESLLATADELKTNKNLLKILNLENTKEEKIVENKLIPFLNKLKESAEAKIETQKITKKLSDQKKNKFVSEILDGYNKNSSIKSLFVKFNKYNNKTEEHTPSDLMLSGFNRLEEREVFFQKWYIDYGKRGEYYGRNLASGENNNLISQLINNCVIADDSSLESLFANINNPINPVIFVTYNSMYDYLETNINFTPGWTPNTEKIDISEFAGWYKIGDVKIPVFKFNWSSLEEIRIIIDINDFGCISQYSPKEDEDDPDSVFYKENFRIRIEDFAIKEQLINQYTNNPPDWLQKVGDPNKQKEFLMKYVLFQMGQRIKFEKGEIDNRGFVYKKKIKDEGI